jgi:Ni/Co efflux regulator RcnB
LGIALNAEVVSLDSDPLELRRLDYASMVRRAESSAGHVRSIMVRRAAPQATTRIAESKPASSREAKDAPVEKTRPDEVFKRFSAYANDNRLNSDGSWRPGTYATTEADARNVKTGMDAVRRYALPNPDPASYVYTSRPKSGTDIQRGIVAPAFGQPGGGVEVIFPAGTQAGTTTGPVKIPER